MAQSDSNLFDQLRDAVVSGLYPPGSRLGSEALAKQYVASASSIREVLFRLSTVGLVDFQEQRGFRMPSVSDAKCSDLTRFRMILECQGAELSIHRGDIEWESNLTASHQRLRHIETHIVSRRGDQKAFNLWVGAEFDFHQGLIAACQSDVLIRTHSVIYQQMRQQLIASDKSFVFVEENIQQHQDILDAALSHDVRSVRKAIIQHLERNISDGDIPKED